MKYADYIRQIEIDSLWSGGKHILWNLDPKVNILSGINGVGKSTIIRKVVRGLAEGGEVRGAGDAGVRLTLEPSDATRIRYDMIGPATDPDTLLNHLQRKYLDYQVNVGNRIISQLQQGHADTARRLTLHKTRFQDLVDELFDETGKHIIRTENEIRFLQAGDTLLPSQLSNGEKQLLVILLTVLVEDQQPCVLFMDEPEVSLHIEWQKRLIELILELNPHVQVILTTHSPAVIMNGWLDSVTDVSDITL